MKKILGIDLGTNSIGLALREDNFITWVGVNVFRKGVGDGKSGEFSFAAERTKHRSSRRLYNARRYRKWETLKVLIENDFCPLSIESLNSWKNYKKGVGRVFPVNDDDFAQWVKLDFNNDGIPDYSSPYQLRRFLIQHQVDLNEVKNRYKIGRALYHIAQRRGFKSSRKSGANEKTAVYNGSNETKTIGRNEYENLIIHNGSLGAAFAFLEDSGIRVRNRYTLRSDYQAEVKKILEIQQIAVGEFSENIEKAIFFQRPLKSQKGLVGKCTFEPNKPRCPISHPRYEEYRAWSFINNIKFRVNPEEDYQQLPIQIKEKLFQEKFFFKSKREFKFSEIRRFIISNGGKNWELNYSLKMDGIAVPSCYVSARLKSALGENWQKYEKKVIRKNKNGENITKTYTIEDVWHFLFSFEDEEFFVEFLEKVLNLNSDQVKELVTLFNSFPVGYANLSLKAINNILPFLHEGMIYSEAAILAKIPEIIGYDFFNDKKTEIIEAIKGEIENNRFKKIIISITNSLIFKYHALNFEEKYAYKDFVYRIDNLDLKDIEKASQDHFGEKTWLKLDNSYKQKILNEVVEYYQLFFSNPNRDHFKQPHLVNQVKQFICKRYNIAELKLNKIYHPSQIDIYPKKEGQHLLNSPKTEAFKNPMAFKTLYKLRDVLNFLIETGKIDEETRIVVEIARELNDSNKRWAIEKYQREREIENLEIGVAISELLKDPEFKGYADPNSIKDNEKFRLWAEQTEKYEEVFKGIESIEKDKNIIVAQKDIQKYKLWKEQNCTCMYTGRIIKLTELFDQNVIDFEHTIPRSMSFDNSLANLTVCYAGYNRDIKKNRMPTELPNYEEESHGFLAIKPGLEKWKKKVDDLYDQIEFWNSKSKTALDKPAKDDAIRQRHLRQMHYDYWRNKLDRFSQTEITSGFVRSQLVDTQIISKYAFHYLKTVFNQVDVLKGTNTAQFRKIYGIQPRTERKDRSKHSHHAIDAAVLTLIPSAKKREEILKRSYEFDEKYRGKQYTEKPFSEFRFSMIEEIERKILINNISDKDRTLTIGKKVVRKRGRVVWLDKENRKVKVAQGDSIRGELHLQTYYGKIKIAVKDDNGSLGRDTNGQIVYNQVDGNDEVWMVLRKSLDKINFVTDNIIDENLAKHIRSQLDRGVKVNELADFQGRKMRHLRCRVKAGRGFMQPENVTIVKEQTYKSTKEYKNFIYSDSGDNYLFGLYENEKGKQIISINKFEASKFINGIIGNFRKEDLFKTKEPVVINKEEAVLKHIFEVGQKVLFFDKCKDELKELDSKEISDRLYFVKNLFDAKTQRILFQHHLEARSNDELLNSFPREQFGTKGKDGFSKLSIDFVAPRLLLTPGNFKFITEGKDFDMSLDGSISYKF